jgi:ornithine--oxo-acid transaminase
MIDREDADLFLEAMHDVLREAHRFPGAAWTTTRNLAVRTARSA